MRRVIVSKSFAIVDTEDYPLVSQYRWWLGKNGYAYTQVKRKTLYMHRLVMQTPLNLETDHVNHDKLDNRRANLRVCDRSANNRNKRPYGKLGVKYVYQDNNSLWPYTVQKDNRTLRRFKTLE